MHAVSGTRSVIVCRERLRVLLPILVGVLLTACVSGGVGSRAEGSELSAGEDDGGEISAALVVQNRSWKPVTVFVSKNGELRRLGNVDASRQRTFSLNQLPFAVDGRDHYLVARPLAGESFRSEAFAFSLERTTVWTIENKTAMSRLAVR
jgi:hypothetical protein